ncbi:glycosyltransferase family 2 protein [Candidatus Roizmanbacteria bacterium]|nr:glycosyltransferase family 2 protein [Candidatus Roizmanbacteria bacterium]
MTKVAIIVLHFADKKNTIECLYSIKLLDFPKNQIELIVVDNGTGSLSAKEIKSVIVQFKLIKSKNNLGFAGGINVGIKQALKNKSVKFVLCLNNDTVVEKNLLKKFIDYSENTSIGILGTIITYYQNPSRIWFAGGYLNELFCYTSHQSMNKYLPDVKTGYVDFITGAAMFVRREVFQEIGLFDSDYFLYWEDVDFCLRAKRKGYSIYCLNLSLLKHKVSSASGLMGSNILSEVRAYYYARNPFIFMKKNKLPLLSGIIGQLFIRFPYYLTQVKDLESLKEYFRGLIDGFKILLRK